MSNFASYKLRLNFFDLKKKTWTQCHFLYLHPVSLFGKYRGQGLNKHIKNDIHMTMYALQLMTLSVIFIPVWQTRA